MNLRPTTWISLTLRFASAALLVALIIAYALRPDAVAALTLYPFWCWSVLGILIATLSHPTQNSKAPLILGAAWLGAAAVFADGIIPLLRGVTPAKPAESNTLRVISLNCAGTADAMQEILALRPDVALLQEVPGTNQVAQLTAQLFGTNGSYVSGFDCAIIARGPLVRLPGLATYFICATLPRANKDPILITSLRLVPPETRSDLWKPEAWRAYTENRQQRTRQLQDILSVLRNTPGRQIVGGDFNAPAGDAIYRLLQGYRDTYAAAGRGWGHTALNNIPIVRPDQIWTKGLRPHTARAVKTQHSDHRLVLVDLEL